MRLLGLLLDNGHVVRDPEWFCIADVMRSFHGFSNRAYGVVVDAETLVQVYPVDGPALVQD